MKLKRLTIYLFFLFLTINGLVLQSQNTTFIINQVKSPTKSIDVNLLKKITFSGTNMVLNYNDGITELITAADITRMTFSIFSGLKNNSVGNFLIFPNPSSDVIFVKNYVLPLTNVSIYTIQGKFIKNLMFTGNYLDVRDLSNGIYVLKVNNQTFKFTKQ